MFDWLKKLFSKKPPSDGKIPKPHAWPSPPPGLYGGALSPRQRPYVRRKVEEPSPTPAPKKESDDSLMTTAALAMLLSQNHSAIEKSVPDFKGGGGESAGAGASGSWDAPNISSNDNDNNSGSSSSSSSSDSGSSSSYDSSSSSSSSSDSGSSSSSGSSD